MDGCYCENPRALGVSNNHNRDTMGFTTLGIPFNDFNHW